MNVRPAIRNLAIVFAVILIPIAAHQLWDYIELRRLIAEIEAIRAKGEPVTESEAGVGDAPESRDAARAGRFYIAAAVLAMNGNRDVYPVMSAISEWLPGGIPAPPADAAERLQAAVAESSEALALADKAGTLTFQGFPPGTDYSYRTSELLMLSRLMGARTIGLGWLGQGDAAIESAMSALPLRRALREVRWLGGLGDGTEVSAILSLSQPSPEALRRLQDSLHPDESDRAIDTVLLQRARHIEITWRRYYGSTPQAPRSYLLPTRSVTETVMRPWITRQTVGTLRIWAELVAAARTPWPARVDAAAAMASKYASDPGSRSFNSVGLLTAIRSAAHYQRLAPYEGFARAMRPDDLVRDRACVLALAVERYRRDHNGVLPGTLQDLAPAYLAAVPPDPATGRPLLFKKAPDAYTIYSVGPDKKDDGGELLKTSEQGSVARRVSGADIGVRVLIR
jgi:hypothetical protein